MVDDVCLHFNSGVVDLSGPDDADRFENFCLSIVRRRNASDTGTFSDRVDLKAEAAKMCQNILKGEGHLVLLRGTELLH